MYAAIVKAVACFALLTVQIFLALNGKYKAITFSMDMMTSNAEDSSRKKYQQK